MLAIFVLGSPTLLVDGVDVEIDSITLVTLGAAPTFVTCGGGSLTLDRGLWGLLSADLLSCATSRLKDKPSIRVNAALVDIGSAVTNLLNDLTVEYVGNADGTFTYERPALSLLVAVTVNTTGMEGYDMLVVVGATPEPDTTLFGGIDSAYRNGNLYL
ncbi:hypothetical protein [Palleronia caenipelagi]|uniref:hypothetical protein n=1 Tax=Palleronia caenipelagi TaxID=2489174 RepID=UPI00115EE5C8|nr:hypothetical protein [Palleronia caenipelagi]